MLILNDVVDLIQPSIPFCQSAILPHSKPVAVCCSFAPMAEGEPLKLRLGSPNDAKQYIQGIHVTCGITEAPDPPCTMFQLSMAKDGPVE